MVRLKPDTTTSFRSRSCCCASLPPSSLLALAMIPLSWIPPERLPAALLVLMPGRYLNFGAMTFVALLIGLLGQPPRALEPARAAVPDVRPARRRPQHAVGVSRAPSRHSAIRATSGRCRSCGWRRPRCSPAPHGRAESRRAESDEPSHPSHPSHPLHLSHLLLSLPSSC